MANRDDGTARRRFSSTYAELDHSPGPFGIAMIRGGSRSAKFHTEIDGDAIRVMPMRADVIKMRRPSGREQLRVRNR